MTKITIKTSSEILMRDLVGAWININIVDIMGANYRVVQCYKSENGAYNIFELESEN